MDSTIRITVEDGKDFRITNDPEKTGYTIDFVQGGQVPELLKGHWTSIKLAKQAVKCYIATRSKPDGSKPRRKRVSNTK